MILPKVKVSAYDQKFFQVFLTSTSIIFLFYFEDSYKTIFFFATLLGAMFLFDDFIYEN